MFLYKSKILYWIGWHCLFKMLYWVLQIRWAALTLKTLPCVMLRPSTIGASGTSHFFVAIISMCLYFSFISKSFFVVLPRLNHLKLQEGIKVSFHHSLLKSDDGRCYNSQNISKVNDWQKKRSKPIRHRQAYIDHAFSNVKKKDEKISGELDRGIWV
jgi:hypothetical protein